MTSAEIAAALDRLLTAMAAHQQARVLAQAQRTNPRLTADDVLQPDDHPELAQDPRWTYEDGVLAGILSAQAAVRAELHGLLIVRK